MGLDMLRLQRCSLKDTKSLSMFALKLGSPPCCFCSTAAIHLQIGDLGPATILNTSCAFASLLIILQKLDDHFQIA